MKRFLIYFAIITILMHNSCGHDAEKRENDKMLKLYYHPLSPASRSVMILLKILDLPYESHKINLFAGEHLSAEYLTINPQHTIPVLIDNGSVIIDSHAINGYLVNQYAKDDKLYPKEPKARANVDHKLYFDTGYLYPFIVNLIRDFKFTKKIDGVDKDMVQTLENIYAVVESFLKKEHRFIAGNGITIADISAMVSLSTLEVVWPVNLEKFPNLAHYMKTCTELIPHFESINTQAVQAWKKVFLSSFNFELQNSAGI